MSKYQAKKVEWYGKRFDSQKEFSRWWELCAMEKAGLISELRLQVPFELIPAIRENGKTIQRATHYIADFVYQENGKTVVEDVKSPATRTEVYKLKRKLMRYVHGIDIQEV